MGRSIPSGGLSLIVCDVIFSFVAIVSVALRVQAARLRSRPFKAHDYLIFAALILGVAFSINQIIGVDPGATGLHVIEAEQELGPDSLVLTQKTFFAGSILWITATTLVKLSILALCIDIFRESLSAVAVWVIGIASIAFFIGIILTACLICQPIAFNWDRTLKGTCGSTVTEEIALATVNMALDISLVLLPMPVLWRLQMPLWKKVTVTCILSFGFAICAINIARIVLVSSANQMDYTYSLTNAALFSALEVNIGILTACLPTLGPLFFDKVMTNRDKASRAKFTADSSTDGFSRADNLQNSNKGFGNQKAFERLQDEEIDLRDVGVAVGDRPTNHAWSSKASAKHANWPSDTEMGPDYDDEAINVRTEVQVYTSGSSEEPREKKDGDV